jgi:TrmH family RNA methyltransferase
MRITSPKNPLLQQIRRAASEGRALEDGSIVLEGPHLLEEVRSSKWTVCSVLVTEEAAQRHAYAIAPFASKVVEVSERALASCAPTEAPQGILTLGRPPESIELPDGYPRMTVILDGIQDPGNAGTILRSAEAFGATDVILTRGCVRVANGKFLRATAGSILRMPFIEGVANGAITEAIGSGSKIYALTPQAARDVESCDFSAACAIVVGSEGAGLSDWFLSHGEHVRIPVRRVESLNAAIACSIALFEAARQRRLR